MTQGAEGQPQRRARRCVAEDIEDVFADMRDRMATADHADTHQASWSNHSLLRSTPGDSVPGLDLAPEIQRSLDWTEAFVEGLQFADGHTKPGTKEPAMRTRLRHVLNMLNHFMGAHPGLNRLGVRDDIGVLALALDAMNSGVTHPLLATQGFNKAPDTKLDQQFRAYVATFVSILMNAEQTRPAQSRRQKGGFGIELATACRIVAGELTEAGFRASRPNEDNPSTEFREATVRRYWYRAHPRTPGDGRHGQSDAQAATTIMNSFVFNATHEGEQMPPSEAYALKVIRTTLRHATFRSLFARKCA